MPGIKRFKNRTEVGKRLAELLSKYKDGETVVYALPRGGVVVGKEIAEKLGCPLDIISVRKIGHPYNPEFAIGAISENGRMVENAEETQYAEKQWLDDEKEKQMNLARKRRELYLGERNPIPAKDKIAILVDDGLATGLTMLCAIKEIRCGQPKKIIAVVPIAPRSMVNLILKEADEFITLDTLEYFFGGVGVYYEEFPQVTDKEVKEIMQRFSAG